MNICVYCSASDHIDTVYYESARELGRLLAEQGHTLVYGGGSVGMMGALALSVKENNGTVIGVIPQDLKDRELGFHDGDELIITNKMSERKHTMDKLSDAFITLPGGFGTLDELFATITLKQLGFMEKEIVIVNVCGFYDLLRPFLANLIEQQFAAQNDDRLYHFSDSVYDAMQYLGTKK